MRSLHYAFLTSASFAALAIAAPANAQTPEPVQPGGDPCQAPADQRDPNVTCPPADSPAGEAVSQGAQVTPEDEGVVVVGSRIRRDRFNTADPVTVINRDAAVDAGFNSTAEVLQSVSVTGGTGQIGDTFGGLVVEGGGGVNTLGLRGLGPNRTLILLNGRRIAPAGTRGQVGAADLNVLPNAILDRIEVLNTGASSIYGSDAVAGVVNIVTLSKFNGLAVEAAVQAPEIGAGTAQRYSITAGTSGERFSILGSLELYDRNRITIGDQPWARCSTERIRDGAGGPVGSGDFIDPATGQPKCFPLDSGGVTVNTIGTLQFGFGGIPLDDPSVAPGFGDLPGFNVYCSRWRPNAAVTGGQLPGFECVSGFLYNPSDPGAGFGSSLNIRDTFAPSILQTDIISPTRNYTGYLTGTYDTDFFGNGQLYAEFLVHRRKSQQNGQRQFTIDYFADSPLLSQDLIDRQGVGDNAGIRVFADYGIYQSTQDEDFVKASAGFRGDLPFASSWRYDLYAAKSWSDGEYMFESILRDRLQKSLNVVQAEDADGNPIPGQFVCADPAGGCVAAPVLTADIVGGRFRQVAPDWFNYVTVDDVGHTKFREWTANLTVDGPLFRLPGGDAQGAFGLEYRKSSIDDTPSTNSQIGNLAGFTSSLPTRGSDNVWEAFGEVELPVLRNVPFAEELTFNVSGRYTDYKSYGSDTTYKVGGLYSPTRWLALRGSYGTSYRAPALFEQFLGATSGFLPSNTDPCDDLASVNNPTVANRCLTVDNLPANFVQNNSVTVLQVGGAEANLKAETSKNLTFGTVFQPPLGSFGNFSLAVDYFRIEINDGVAQLSANTLLNGCYNGSRPEYCVFIEREPFTIPGTGELTVNQRYINIATDIVKGIDFVARFDKDIGPGKLDIGANVVHILDRINQTNPDSEATNFVGSIGNPKWAGTGHIGYDIGPWYVRWGAEFIQGTDDSFLTEDIDDDGNIDFPTDVFDFSVPDYWLHTASVRFEPSNRYSLTLGVRNVFDKKPPKISFLDPFVNTVSNVPLQSGWDFRGRTFFLNAQAKIF